MTRADSPPSHTQKVFTVPAGLPFVDALAAGISARVGNDPSALTQVRVLLPNRRACRALAEAFLRRSGGRPMLLPRITPIGDIDEDELAIAGPSEEAMEANISVPPAIPDLRRQLLMTRLILAIPSQKRSPEQAARLAAELNRFFDHIRIEDLDFSRLNDLVPDALAEHWQITLDFLAIVTDAWPKILDSEGCLDPPDRRNRLLDAQAAIWESRPPKTPVIVAGSTGTIPATARLMKVVSRLPQGALVLPGLDQTADDDTWAAIVKEPSHPQYGMARLLAHLEVDRGQVRMWKAADIPETISFRATIINRALRPAATVDSGQQETPTDDALSGIHILEAPGPDEEARAIALLMRSILEDARKTAALVTPDRALSRRVATELDRWGVTVDDSAGRPLAQTPPGSFLRLTARMGTEALAPVPLLAALKHPLAACGLSPQTFRSLVRRLEKSVLRGPRPAPGIAGLASAIADGEPDLRHLVKRLATALDSFLNAQERPLVPFADLLHAHVAATEALARTDREPGRTRLWSGDAGEALAGFVAELGEAANDFDFLSPRDYPALLDALIATRVVRPRYGRHPRLFIWGPLEARLQRADVMILGSLNEESWPPKALVSPWMSRPMMEKFGLPVPERRIGLSAHDFTQAFSASEVWLTRARRVEGAPTVECRWLLKLKNLIGDHETQARLAAGDAWLDWQSRIDTRDPTITITPPAPTPPVSTRPRRLSVTQVERWMRDPYSIYARHILNLEALKPIDADPIAADLGTFIHLVLQQFIDATPGSLPDDAYDRLIGFGRDAWHRIPEHSVVRAFWWPRFTQAAEWFIEVESDRRKDIRATATEIAGKLTLDMPGGAFELTAKADRIDVCNDGSLIIVDYKTGQTPSQKDIEAGYSPQLPLEAAIARAGGFPDIPANAVAALEYWRLRGGATGGETKAVRDADKLASEAVDGLVNLVTRFDLPGTPYEARPRPSVAPRYSDYEHLARVKEWSTSGREDSE